MLKCIVGLVLLLPMVGAILADAEEPTNVKIEEKVEVVGKVSLNRSLQSVSIYSEEEFKGFKFESLKSLFNLTPGILVLNSGNPGQFAYSYARGASVNQILYLVNGIKLFDPANAMGGNFSFLSPELVEKVEIVRGPMSNRYGSNAMGGVVNIITKKSGTSVSVTGGSHGTYEGSLHFSENSGPWRLSLSGSSLDYSDNRINDRFRNKGVSVFAGYDHGRMSYGINFFGSLADAGIPLYMGKPTVNRHYSQNNFLVSVPFSFQFSEKTSLEVKSSWHSNSYDFSDPDDSWTPVYSNNSQMGEIEMQIRSNLLQRLDFSFGLDCSFQNVSNRSQDSIEIDGRKTGFVSGFFSGMFDLKKILISGSVRFDQYRNLRGVVSPQVGMSYQPIPQMKFRLSHSRSFRAPTLPETLNPFWGNVDLLPERGKSWEVGLDLYLPAVTIDIAVFSSLYRDLIGFSPLTFRFANIQRAKINGLEAGIHSNIIKNLTISISYTHLNPLDLQYDRMLLRRPKHALSTAFLFKHRGFSLSLETLVVGKRLDYDEILWSLAENRRFDTETLTLFVPLSAKVSLFSKVSNLLNHRFEEVWGYPAPMRRMMFGLKYQMD